MIHLLTFPMRLLWGALVVTVPLLGVWLATSLTTYSNGPVWAACVAGALLCPIAPLLWEARAHGAWKRKREGARERGEGEPKRLLTFWDRMTLRTMSINLLFVATLIGLFPAKGFEALSSRGDWMLPREDTSAPVQTARELLFGAASGLGWLYELAVQNPYERYDDGSSAEIKPEPNPVPVTAPPQVSEPPEEEGDGPQRDVPQAARAPGEVPRWPMRSALHEAVANLPPEHEVSVESVARYIASQESDPFLRVKALHDYVADRIAYDAESLAQGIYPPQDVETVFKTRKAVCAGYATMMVELGEHTGDEIVYISGDSRGLGGDVSGGGHAWNAAKIEGRWYLIDSTWDAGTVEGGRFNKQYSTAYLFTPPTAFVHDHWPENASWQLLKAPITRGEFMRYPVLKPQFFAKGFELLSPKRSQVTAEGAEFTITLKSARNVPLLANITAKGKLGSEGTPCAITGVDTITVRCAIAQPGTYQVWLFAKGEGTTYPFIGQLEVNR